MRCMAGRSLKDQGIKGEVIPPYYSVKEAVFPFIKFPGVDTILGPEMKSTGEVMGVGLTFAEAFVKSQMGAGVKLPVTGPNAGNVFLSVRNADKPKILEIAKTLQALGFGLKAFETCHDTSLFFDSLGDWNWNRVKSLLVQLWLGRTSDVIVEFDAF